MEIIWPDAYKPVNTAVHVRNELLMPGVELEGVWAWLCRPGLWPTWYSNSSNVHVKNQTHPDLRLGELRLGTEFRWKTFGVTIDSTVLEFVRHERLAWDAHCNGVHAYHAWAFEKKDGGVYVLTEETQTGWLARLGAHLMPGRMSRWHQRWLEGLVEQAGKWNYPDGRHSRAKLQRRRAYHVRPCGPEVSSAQRMSWRSCSQPAMVKTTCAMLLQTN